jgi:endonuclease YncB( thermonuclease family)
MPLTSIDFPFQPPRGVGPRAMTLSSAYSNSNGVMKSIGRAMEFRDRFLAAVLACGMMLAAAAATQAVAAGCNFEPQGDGRVSAIIDARSFRMEDGREVRLAGIETVGKSDGISTLSALVAGRDVTLRGESDAPDRYGRQPAFVFPDQAGASVQSQLLMRGEALFSGNIADKACAAELIAAEAQARQAKRGVWAEPAAIKNAESPGDILARIGQFTVVEGKVLSVRQAGAVTYVNFGRRWTRDFAVTISRRAGLSFEAAGIVVKSLENKRIRVRGFIESRGGPRIEARTLEQIELAGEN